MFYLRNLSSIATEPGKPWEFTALDRVPVQCLGKEGKKARNDWITGPKTDFFCYSMFEGVNPNLRIRAPGKDEDGNPVVAMYGLAVDYDYPLTEEEIEAALNRMPPDLRPQWREKTLSGNLRLVWVFFQPLLIPTHSFVIKLLETLDQIIPFRQLAGIDEGALKAPERYYTNGCVWKQINPLPFPHAMLLGHVIKFSEKFDWKGPEFAYTGIPLDIVAAQLKEKYPRFSEWPGDFVEGAQGPSFWLDGSTSPKSAMVRPGGMATFANHAHGKGFFHWPELIGADFCDRYKIEQIGKASDGIFYDEKHYFSRNTEGTWCIDPKENIILLLRQERGLSDARKKGALTSEVEQALVQIQRRNRIKVAAPFPFYPEGRVHLLGETVLNLHTRKALSPAEQPGPFPFISEFLKTLFDPAEQLEFFISWLAYFYRSCYLRSPRSGHAVYIAGGTNVGKTFLNRAIVGGLVGGFAEAHAHITGEDKFNQELFEYALWCIDDGSIASNFAAHRRCTEMMKRIVANPTMRCNGKFLKANTTKWQGRLMVSCNLDPESIRMLPDLDLSTREKVMLLRTHSVAQVKFLQPEEMSEMLKRELPYFARYLLDFQIPAHCLSDDPRFGVQPYLEKSLVDTANQSSVSGAFSEILEEWMRVYFMEQEPQAEKWEGTALQLYKSILMDHTLVEAMKPFNVQSVGRMMVSLVSKNFFGITVGGEETRRIFVIPRHARFPLPKKVIAPTAPAGPSKFEK